MITDDYFYVFKVNPLKLIDSLGRVGDIGKQLTELYDKYYITKIDGDVVTAKKYIRTTKKSKKDLFEEPETFSLKELETNQNVFTHKDHMNNYKDWVRNQVMDYILYLKCWLKDINMIKIRSNKITNEIHNNS